MDETRGKSRERNTRWICNLENSLRSEWILYDGDTQRFRLAKAENQKEAIKIALERNIIPRQTDDVRPRKGTQSDSIMAPEEFDKFMEKLRQ